MFFRVLLWAVGGGSQYTLLCIENCTFYKPMQSQNSTFHLVLWLFSIHFKAYEVTLNMADGRSAVGGRPKLSNMSQVFFSCPRLYKN